MAKLIFLFAAVLLISWVQPGSAIKCYECTAGCADPFKASDASESTIDCTYCTKVKGEAASTTTVGRSCGIASKPDMKCTKQGASGATSETCYCDGELCNGATTMFISMATISVALLVAKAIF